MHLLQVLNDTPQTYAAWERTVRPLLNLTDVFTYDLGVAYSMTHDSITKNYFIYNNPNKTDGMCVII